ncbi:MAG: penicillin-binding protein 1C, partial [Paludibacteraceae bacterium]|nr:penicillin-binding protein 1C [Paludibacteraceae bacterium]
MAITTPHGVFRSVYSTLLYSSNGTLMNAHIASDGQWRFPPCDTVPEKFRKAIVNYEDRWFYWHPGVNPVSMVKAAVLNFKRGRIVSGGSTLTMQVSRISSESRERTYWRKFVELNRALYIELRYSKDEILAMYASHAPFGGNVVGIEAASWRYFSCPASHLTWAQAAMLAVLPNSPSLVHISRNRELLLKKRNALLATLHKRGVISDDDYSLAVEEPIPAAPENLPQAAPHLASTLLKTHRGEAIHTHIDLQLQNALQSMADQYAREYTLRNQLHNIAILVQEVGSGNIIAYVGNASFKADERFCNSVDIITSPRSTGSILKPVLYAAMLSDGMILPHTLIPDVPLYLKGFNPQNYNKGYSGVVPADEAIIRSLNVPLVRMLRDYGIDRFLKLLRSLGITTMNRDADHYGASLILGGAEATLQEICGMYALLAKQLESGAELYDVTEVPVSLSGLWFMFEAMSRLNRPEEEADWQQFESMKKIAWKTGTSYGGKDAWAIGVNPQYVVGVWVGNATGEGRSGMTGVGYAAPVMLRAFSHLRTSSWFDP